MRDIQEYLQPGGIQPESWSQEAESLISRFDELINDIDWELVGKEQIRLFVEMQRDIAEQLAETALGVTDHWRWQ